MNAFIKQILQEIKDISNAFREGADKSTDLRSLFSAFLYSQLLAEALKLGLTVHFLSYFQGKKKKAYNLRSTHSHVTIKAY